MYIYIYTHVSTCQICQSPSNSLLLFALPLHVPNPRFFESLKIAEDHASECQDCNGHIPRSQPWVKQSVSLSRYVATPFLQVQTTQIPVLFYENTGQFLWFSFGSFHFVKGFPNHIWLQGKTHHCMKSTQPGFPIFTTNLGSRSPATCSICWGPRQPRSMPHQYVTN